MDNLAQFEADLWEAADNLRANSKLTSSDYFMPVLGIIFLRHAANRFDAATQQIAADQESGKMPKRKILPADYIRRRALFLPDDARYDTIMAKASSDPAGLPKLVTDAMTAIEADFEPLANVLPKDYGIFEPKVLEELMRKFNSELIKKATGDVFGRIYEYFLAKFSIQKAHDNGEFFTPSSLVQLIVNVIEPDHGNVFDPACGSGGMFAQTSHFIEQIGGDTTKKVVFYGQEKNRDTIRIAKMNLAVHGLEGKIAEAITYYQDEHNLAGKEKLAPGQCDFVMANPPFNVDLVDAERIKTDPRLPFGLPGVNKDKRVSNGNYLWISYFWSYLTATGRAGFVMSSQASSAGNDEKTVRQKLVETGDVDVMISIKGGFFYTRTVPCELWHFDRAKPAERKDQVLMLDARSIGQLMKGSRKVFEFTPEQMRNLTAIVWLYRGQKERFTELVDQHIDSSLNAAQSCFLSDASEPLDACIRLHADLRSKVRPFLDSLGKNIQAEVISDFLSAESDSTGPVESFRQMVADAQKHRNDSGESWADICDFARTILAPLAEQARGLVAVLDLQLKRSSRLVSVCESELGARKNPLWDNREVARAMKAANAARETATECLKAVRYFQKHAAWLIERFPKAEMQAVPGLVKIVSRAEIAAADWSLTPGRYVGVAPAEVDEDFDFAQTMQDIHAELAELNTEAAELAGKIAGNFEALL